MKEQFTDTEGELTGFNVLNKSYIENKGGKEKQHLNKWLIIFRS